MAGGAMNGEVDVAIVGAGAAGIAAARHLAEAGPNLRVQLIEAGARIGGRAHTILAGLDGLPVDLGCGWLHGARDNVWTDLARSLGFVVDMTQAPWDGAGRELGLRHPDEDAAEAALEAFFERAHGRAAEEPDVPMSDILAPGGRWNNFIDAIGTYINGAELDRASLRDYGRYDPGRGPDRRVRDGYGSLVAAAAAGLPTSCDTIVRGIDHGGPGVRLDTSRGTLVARAVIVTVSTHVLAEGAMRFTPALPDKRDAAAGLPLGVANKLFFRVAGTDHPVERHLMGSTARTGTGAYHLGPFGRPVVECYFGGELARAVEWDPASARAFAIDELAGLLGSEFARRLTPLAASAWAGQPFIGGSYSYAKPGCAENRGRLAAPVGEKLFFAGEACSPHRFSTAHGAYETGVAAAAAAIAALA